MVLPVQAPALALAPTHSLVSRSALSELLSLTQQNMSTRAVQNIFLLLVLLVFKYIRTNNGVSMRISNLRNAHLLSSETIMITNAQVCSSGLS